MSQPVANHSEALWQRLVESQRAHLLACREFAAEGVDHVTWVRKGIWTPGVDRAAALTMLPVLSLPERMSLLGDLVFLASWAHGSVQAAREQILALPRAWVLANIEQHAEPLLQEGTDDEYRRFLELYELLDRDLALRLARRAAAHEDPDIREAGNDFLEKLRPATGGNVPIPAGPTGDGQNAASLGS